MGVPVEKREKVLSRKEGKWQMLFMRYLLSTLFELVETEPRFHVKIWMIEKCPKGPISQSLKLVISSDLWAPCILLKNCMKYIKDYVGHVSWNGTNVIIIRIWKGFIGPMKPQVCMVTITDLSIRASISVVRINLRI